MKLMAAGFMAVILVGLNACKSKSAHDGDSGSANLEAAGSNKKAWSCVGQVTTSDSDESSKDLARLSIFSDGAQYTQVQLYQAASGSSSTWKPSEKNSGVVDNPQSLKISQWELVGGGKKAITDGAFSVSINKSKKATGPNYQFKIYSNMDGFQAEVKFKGASVIGTWVQKFAADGKDWVCSNQPQYLN